jgi:hypothetical protein
LVIGSAVSARHGNRVEGHDKSGVIYWTAAFLEERKIFLRFAGGEVNSVAWKCVGKKNHPRLGCRG